MKSPFLLFLGVLFAASALSTVWWGPRMRTGRSADDWRADTVRIRITRRVAFVSAAVFLVAGIVASLIV